MPRVRVYWVERYFSLQDGSTVLFGVTTGWVDINHMKDASETVLVYQNAGFADTKHNVGLSKGVLQKRLLYKSLKEANVAYVKALCLN